MTTPFERVRQTRTAYVEAMKEYIANRDTARYKKALQPDGFAVALVVSEVFGVSLDDMLGTSRIKAFVQARHCFYWLLHYHLGVIVTHIADRVSVDHTSVIHGIRAANQLIEGDIDIAAKVRRVIRLHREVSA